VPDSFHCIQTHPRRRTRGKDAIDHLFPELSIRACLPDRTKLGESTFYLPAARRVCSQYIFNGDGKMGSLHGNRLTTEFYWRALMVVNERFAQFSKYLEIICLYIARARDCIEGKLALHF
jgi:hypothetical protein